MSFVDLTFETTPFSTFHSAGMAGCRYPRQALMVGSIRFRHSCETGAEADAVAGDDDAAPPLLAAEEQPRSTAPNPSTVSEESVWCVMM
jgi:hypothetical protein